LCGEQQQQQKIYDETSSCDNRATSRAAKQEFEKNPPSQMMVMMMMMPRGDRDGIYEKNQLSLSARSSSFFYDSWTENGRKKIGIRLKLARARRDIKTIRARKPDYCRRDGAASKTTKTMCVLLLCSRADDYEPNWPRSRARWCEMVGHMRNEVEENVCTGIRTRKLTCAKNHTRIPSPSPSLSRSHTQSPSQ